MVIFVTLYFKTTNLPSVVVDRKVAEEMPVVSICIRE